MSKGTDINARTQDKLRSGIKAAEIIKALSNHILAGLKMTNTQVRAAEILLRKVSPDLLATAISDDRTAALPVLQIVRGSADTRPQSAQDTPQSKVTALPAVESAPDSGGTAA